MAKYKLLSPHYSEEDKLLETDAVGDGTLHKWSRRPTVEMEGLDDEGKQLVERERVRMREVSSQDNRIAPLEDLPLTIGEVEKKYDSEVEASAAETRVIEASTRQPTLAERRVAATLADRIRR